MLLRTAFACFDVEYINIEAPYLYLWLYADFYGIKFCGSDVDDKKMVEVSSTSQVSGKRLSDNIEVAPAAKRQALESSIGSPKTSSPKRLVPLSRESSFKSLDKSKVKPGLLMPIRNHSGGIDTEIARSPSIGPRGQNPKGMDLFFICCASLQLSIFSVGLKVFRATGFHNDFVSCILGFIYSKFNFVLMNRYAVEV